MIDFEAAAVRWSPHDGIDFTDADAGLRAWLKPRIASAESHSVRVIHEHANTVAAKGLLGFLSSSGRSEVMTRGRSLGRIDGCVVLAFPLLKRLSELSRSVQPGATVVVYEYGSPPVIDGWVAATGAFDPLTGERSPQLDAELHRTFTSMLMWEREIGEGPRRGRQKEFVQRPLALLKAAGLDEDFVLTYCAALGLSEHYFARLREHYRLA